MENDDELDCQEDHVTFQGTCTCAHDPEQHGWGHCGVDSCNCEAGWEE